MHLSILYHPGTPLAPHDLWSSWNPEVSILLPVGILLALYLWGVRNLWRSASVGRGITLRQLACFLGAVLSLLVALVSPLDALSGTLFSAHMLQHLVLMLAAAPLLAGSHLPLALLWALPRRWSQGVGRGLNRRAGLVKIGRMLTRPVSAWLLFTLAVWAWHAPVLYEAALRSETVHALEHAFFLSTAVLFWWVLFRRSTPDRLRYSLAVPYLFTTLLQSGVLGALMTFTERPWYPYYAPLTAAWGLTPLQDQQLAGLVMWLPGGAVFSLLTIGYFAAWLRAMEHPRTQPLPKEE